MKPLFNGYRFIFQSVPFKAKLNYMKRLFFRLTALSMWPFFRLPVECTNQFG